MNNSKMSNSKITNMENKIRLSGRLRLVASFVRENSRIADIGTDHGYVPIFLAGTGRICSALAMDVREGPLMRAREHIREYEEDCRAGNLPLCPVKARLSDGLKELKPGEADTVIIAGMGGELEIRILEEGQHMWESVEHWILSPQSDLDKVRRFLAENGFLIEKEAMIREDGKFYTVMDVARGTMEYKSQSHYLYGRLLIENHDPVLAEYLEREKKRVEGILAGLEMASGETGERTGAQQRAVEERTRELEWIREAQNEMQ
ncbi:MAG: tRNA (adenine(22)-N(1))-methyltransferase [Enterocloster sp.]